MLEGNWSLAFDLQKGPSKLQAMELFARCQFLPSHHLKAFKEIFLTKFFTDGLVIFSPFSKNPTYRYLAYKDVEEGNPICALINKEEDAQRAEKLTMATTMAYTCHKKQQDH